MYIGGVDCSSSSPGITKMKVDENYNIIEVKFLSFTKNTKSEYDFIKSYGQFKFENRYQKFNFLTNEVREFLIDCEYIAFEEYSFGSFGGSSASSIIAEIAGHMKIELLKTGMKLRHFAVKSIKKFATGHGGNNKLGMYEAYLKHPFADPITFDYDKIVKDKKIKGKIEKVLISSMDDIFDSFWICEFLRYELLLRNNIIDIKKLSKHRIECFEYTVRKKATKTRVSSKTLIKIVDKPFDSI